MQSHGASACILPPTRHRWAVAEPARASQCFDFGASLTARLFRFIFPVYKSRRCRLAVEISTVLDNMDPALPAVAVDATTLNAAAPADALPATFDGSRLHPLSSMKRGRDEISDDLPRGFPKTVGASQEANRGKRSRRNFRTDLLNLPPQHVIVHQVSCFRDDNHTHHSSQSQYLDVPRLFAGDNKASALRGKRHFPDLEDYLESNPDISFIVYRSYSCNEYHEAVKDDFDRLQIPHIDPAVRSQLRAYLFALKRDGEAASPNAEEIRIVSEDLQDAMATMESLHPDQFGAWDPQRGMRAPYLQLYHCRSLMDDYATTPSGDLSQTLQDHIRALFNYVIASYGEEYQEADDLFEEGLVNQYHFPKLFGPNEIVVTVANNQPLAYISEICPALKDGHLELNCWSWDFDGLFRKEKINLPVLWPQDYDTVPISSLMVYPLRYDRSGLDERLRNRGKQFWECRKRTFVGYESPNPTFEVQAVRLAALIHQIKLKLRFSRQIQDIW
jgi:hypothetical protein